MKLNKYKINLFFNTFPSYSVSAWVTSIFVQPRLFGLFFLFNKDLKFRLASWNVLLFVNLLITIIIPILGLFFGRTFYYLDLAYILSSIYSLLFINTIISKQKNILIFEKFIRLILMLNIFYILVQLLLYYSGFDQFTMIHSNVPFHVNSGYQIEPGVISFIPRYTGLWIESGPLIFFLCLTFPYLLQNGVNYSKSLKIVVLIFIILSQSKFLFLFVPVIIVEFIFTKMFPRFYKLSIRPLFISFFFIFFIFFLLFVIFHDFEFHKTFSAEIPAYNLRLEGLRSSLTSFLDFGPFGKGLLPSTIDLSDSKFTLQSTDAFSIIFLGYGFFPGIILLLSILLIPILSNITYKYTFCSVLIFGFMSSGSLIVPQYLFAIAFAIVGHYQNSADKQIVIVEKLI